MCIALTVPCDPHRHLPPLEEAGGWQFPTLDGRNS